MAKRRNNKAQDSNASSQQQQQQEAGVEGGAGGGGRGVLGGSSPRLLEDFLDVMEMLNLVADEGVNDVLEDSYGLIMKHR